MQCIEYFCALFLILKLDPNQHYYGGPQQQGYPMPGYPPQSGYPPQPGFGQPGFPPQQGYPGAGPGAGYPQPGFGYPPQSGGFAAPPQGQYGNGDDPSVKGFDFTDQSVRRAFIRKVYSILMVSVMN